MSPSPSDYLLHILEETNYILSHCEDVNKNEFLLNETLKRAFVRSLEIIGEAIKKLPDSLRQKYNKIQWKMIAGMRDKLIHDYFGVDYEIVWDVVINKIPILKQEIIFILKNEFNFDI